MGTDDDASAAAAASLRAELAGAWRSERLVYRAVTSDDDDVAFIQSVNSDPASVALSDSGLLRPRTRGSARHFADALGRCLLGVLICLPAEGGEEEEEEDDDDDDDDDENKDKDEEKKKRKKKKKKKDTPVGFLCLGGPSGGGGGGDGGADAAAPSHHHRRAALGIALAAAHQGRGYGAEATRWALGWAFRFANLHGVGLDVAAYNERARRVYERVGFVREGRSREAVFCGGRYWDLLHYSMLEGEWARGPGR